MIKSKKETKNIYFCLLISKEQIAMGKLQKHLFVYIMMLLILGGGIYVSISLGNHFHSASTTFTSKSSYQLFLDVLKDNFHHPFALLLFQIIVVLFSVRIFAYLFKYIGQPGVIGEIVAGIFLGPSICGALFPEFFNFLFQPSSLKNLELVSQIGLVLFMFVIGMEVDFKALKSKINQTLVISHAGILAPFLLGVLASLWIYEEYASAQVPFLPFALFIGISMSITAFPVLARIIQERNMTKTHIGVLTIASAANDDVTAWCLLAVVIAITKAGTFGGALFTIISTLLYIFIMFLLVRPFLKKLGDTYSNKELINKTFVGFIFLVLILSSAVTEILGIHALFGAFIAGVVMPSNFGFRKVMMDKVEDVALVFFLPLFFAFTGLRTEISLINTPELLIVCLFLILVAVAGKIGGCSIAARLVGEKWKDSLIIGTLMNTRGLMELVALNIGYELGVLPPSIFVILVLMALVTTFMTTPMLDFVEWKFRTNEFFLKKRKLFIFFGNPKSGAKLLWAYSILFGKKLNENYVAAIHYTNGTDINPTNATEFMRNSFAPINNYSQHLNVNVESIYRVTDNIVGDILEKINNEKPALVLMGSGPNFMNVDLNKLPIIFNMFKNKVDSIIDKVDSTVGVLINHSRKNGGNVPAVFINGEVDNFFFLFISNILKAGSNRLNVYYWNTESVKYNTRLNILKLNYPDRIELIEVDHINNLKLHHNEGLLLMSITTSDYILEHHASIFASLPPVLMIKPGNLNLYKTDEFDNIY